MSVKISALPTDAAPDGADLIPFVDVSPTPTTEAVTVANLAASAAFAGAYAPSVLDEDGFATNSTTRPPSQRSVATYVAAAAITGGSVGALDERYRSGSLAPMARANKITQDGGVLRVGLMGTSIASFAYALPALGAKLQNEYGRADHRHVRAGLLGGSWTNAFQGWEKQPYGGRSYTRLRGKAASSSNLTADVYGDTVSLWFSVEANSEACDIEIDGVVVGATPASGTQQYAVKQVYDGLTVGAHLLEIVKPAGAGFVYLEEYEGSVSSVPGVAYYDWTLGGSALKNSAVLSNPSGAQVAGIAVGTNVGIDGYFADDDIDLFVLMHDVNDSGNQSDYATHFTPLFQRAVALTRASATPLVLVSSMAGNHALPTANQLYFTIRDLYRDTALAESHVTHVDWHGATFLEDLDVYAATYYSGVTGLDVDAGTYTGDFIHPDANARAALQHEFAKAFAIAPADAKTDVDLKRGQALARYQAAHPTVAPTTRDVFRLVAPNPQATLNGTTDTFTTTNPHGLAVGDKIIFSNGISGAAGFTYDPHFVLSVPSATTFTTSLTVGGDQWTTSSTGTAISAVTILHVEPRQYQGLSETGLAPRWYAGLGSAQGFDDVPVWFDPTAHSADGSAGLGELRATIGSAPDGTDAYGPYKSYTSNFNLTIRNGVSLTTGQVAYLLVRFAGRLSVWPDPHNGFLDMDGNVLPVSSSGLRQLTFPETAVGDPPVTAVVPVKATSTSTNYVTIPGSPSRRIYDFAVSPSPIWPGRYT